ncbi:hypothetical protein MTO96_031509 [Rhipicephalus appendiculatus]
MEVPEGSDERSKSRCKKHEEYKHCVSSRCSEWGNAVISAKGIINHVNQLPLHAHVHQLINRHIRADNCNVRLRDLWQLLKLLSLKILATLKVVCHAVLSFFNILEWSNIIAYNNEKTAWSATHFEIFLLTTVDIKLLLKVLDVVILVTFKMVWLIIRNIIDFTNSTNITHINKNTDAWSA